MLFSLHCEKELGLAKYINNELRLSTNFNRQFLDMDWDIIPKKNIFNDSFNHSIDNLPVGIEYLYLGHSFNKTLDKLPHSVKHIHFSHSSLFNQPITNLPSKLKML